jgi:hypothetical protein
MPDTAPSTLRNPGIGEEPASTTARSGDLPAPASGSGSGAPATTVPGGGGMLGAPGSPSLKQPPEPMPTAPNIGPAPAMGAVPGGAAPLDQKAADEYAADRDKLLKQFDMVPPGTDPSKRGPNQLTPEEFEQYALLYSNIRSGKTALQVDTAAIEGEKAKQEFLSKTMDDMAKILQTSNGRELLQTLAAGRVDENGEVHTTKISGTAGNDPSKSDAKPDLNPGAAAKPNQSRFDPTKGSDMRVEYAPGEELKPKEGEGLDPMRSDVVLFHELAHALHGVSGTTKAGWDKGTTDGSLAASNNEQPRAELAEEYATVGLGSSSGNRMTENAYRAERQKLGATGQGLDSDQDMAFRTRYGLKGNPEEQPSASG